MNNLILKCSAMFAILKEEHGQDLVEYGLVLALVALGAVASMQSLAGAINNAFSSIGNKMSTYTS